MYHCTMYMYGICITLDIKKKYGQYIIVDENNVLFMEREHKILYQIVETC